MLSEFYFEVIVLEPFKDLGDYVFKGWSYEDIEKFNSYNKRIVRGSMQGNKIKDVAERIRYKFEHDGFRIWRIK